MDLKPIVLLLKLIIFLVILLFGWYIISEAADLYVYYFIRPKTGWYNTNPYSYYFIIYVFCSLVLISIALFLKKAFTKKPFWIIFWIIVFGLIIGITVFEEVLAGRSFLPEIFFYLVIMIFQIIMTRILSWAMNLKRTSFT